MLAIQISRTYRNPVAAMAAGFLLLMNFMSTSAMAEEHEGLELPYHLSIVLADTHVDGEGNNPTVGIDIEYRVNDLLGIGAVVEYAWGELDSTTVLAVADIHLIDGWVMQIGPGFERRHGEDVFVSRVGLLYEFEWEHYTFSPQLHWDYHEGEENAIVAGFAIGFSF